MHDNLLEIQTAKGVKVCYTEEIMSLPLSHRVPLHIVCAVSASLVYALWPMITHAQLPAGWDGALCGATGLCNNSPTTGVMSIVSYAIDVAIPAARTLLIGVGVVYFFYYAVYLMMEGHNEAALTDARKSFSNAAFGLAFIGLASLIVETFSPTYATSNIVAPDPFYEGVETVVHYLTLATGVFLIFIISTAGFRIIALQGDEGEIEKQRKNFFAGLLGVVLLLVARIGVLSIIPSGPLGPGVGVLGLVGEFAGGVKFLLELVAGLAVISLIASGILYILALQSDERMQRAKRIAISTIIVLVIVIVSHMLISTFIPATVDISAGSLIP